MLPLKHETKGWLVTIIAALFFCYEFIQMNMFNALSRSFDQDFQLNAMTIGMVSSAYFLADAIFLYPAGVCVDRYNSRKMILLGMVMCILGNLVIAIAPAPIMLVMGRVLAGIASAFCLLSILRLASEWFPPQKMGQITGVVVTIGMLGGVCAQLPLTYLISILGWREALVSVSFIGVGIFVLIAIAVRVPPEAAQFTQMAADENVKRLGFRAGFMLMARNRNNWLVGLYISLMNLPIILLGGLYALNFVRQVHGIEQLDSATISMMLFVGMIVGASAFGFITDFYQSRRRPMLAGAVCALIVFLIILFKNEPGVHTLGALFFFLGFFSASQVVGYPVVRETNRPDRVGSALGFVSILIMGLPALLQPLTGYLIQLAWSGDIIDGVSIYSWFDYFMGFSVLLVGFVVSIICVLLLPETYQHEA